MRAALRCFKIQEESNIACSYPGTGELVRVTRMHVITAILQGPVVQKPVSLTLG